MFYPAAPDALHALIADVRARARPDGGVAAKVVVAPHAGLVYSGSVAATAFGPWARRAAPPRRIVIVGPAHRVAFEGIAVHPASDWRTPLGEIPVAGVTHAELAQAPSVVVDPRPFAGEHSLEMHLIMLQAMLPAPFEIVPILVGDADPHKVAEALRRVWGGPETVVAVSSDLSHFLDQRSALSIDSDTARRIETLDAAALDGRRACGFLAVKAALEIAAERDMRVSGLHLATSADAGAEASRVVGYGAFAFEYAASARLAETDRERLLSACMSALRVATETGGKAPPVESRRRAARVLALARDLRHADRKRAASRLHRFARAASAADRGCARQHGANGLCRPALPAAEGVGTHRGSHRHFDSLPPAATSRE